LWQQDAAIAIREKTESLRGLLRAIFFCSGTRNSAMLPHEQAAIPHVDSSMNDDRSPENGSITRAGWIGIAILFALLGWAFWYAIRGWGTLSGVGVSTFGWVMLVLGVVVTLVVGGGLMALLFYSSRKNYDR
jgi:hypothetical protein